MSVREVLARLPGRYAQKRAPESSEDTPAEADMIDEASRESFPASDAPSWTRMSSGTPKPGKDG